MGPTTLSAVATSRRSRPPTPSTAASAVSVDGARGGVVRVAFEVEPRVRRIEQQLQEKLLPEWREFAGEPMQIQYYDNTINTFRDNEHLRPSGAYVRHAVEQLKKQLELEKLSVLTGEELRGIVLQEWRTDMTRSVWQTRLNRHGSKDGPVARRSMSGVITITSQPPSSDTKFVVDALVQDKKSTRRVRW